jgi:hypothetical protein
MQQRAFSRPQQAQRTMPAVFGKEIFGVPVFDVGGDTVASLQ